MIILNGYSLTLADLWEIAKGKKKLAVAEENKEKIIKAENVVKKISESDQAVYGINTGFGHLSTIKINKEDLNDLQINLLKSHACGVGDILPKETVRVMMALRINAIIQGYSGISLETVLKMVELYNSDVIPVVYEKGSLGASGDLALLSHMSLPLLGLGEVIYQDKIMNTAEVLKLLNIKPLSHLKPKEGLSLINGTQGMSAIGGLVLYEGFKLYKFANLALAMTMEALLGVVDAFDNKVHEIRRQLGQIEAAKDILNNLEGSQNITKQNSIRVQDAYSIRCAPQVHGACLDALEHTKTILEREINAVTDNPLIFGDEAISAGNFHGEPLALVFDYLSLALAELANISERRLERMVNPHLSGGLPPFLAKYSGTHSGFMIVQYTAASLVSENKVLAHPASVDSIPSSANQEDHVSMGSISVRKARNILNNAYKVISMEMFTAAQAIDLRNNKGLGKNTKKAYEIIRKQIPFIEKDTTMYPYLQIIEKLLKDDQFESEVFK